MWQTVENNAPQCGAHYEKHVQLKR